MNRTEKEFLKKVANYHEGLLTPVVLFNGIGEQKSDKIIHKLIAERYIDEVPQEKFDSLLRGNYKIIFYRLSDKGYLVFSPIWKRLWSFFSGDMAKILSLIAITISILVGLKQLGWL